MEPALSQVCSLHWPLEEDLAGYPDGACRSVEIWLGKLDAYLKDHSPDDVRRLLQTHHLQAPVASYQGGLFAPQADQRREHFHTFQRHLALCRAIGTTTLVLAADIFEPITQESFQRLTQSLSEAAGQAAEHGLRLALEFQAAASFVNNLETAAALVEHLGQPNLGLCLDVFHFYKGPSKLEDLVHVTADNLLHVQVCDVAGQFREEMTDADRVLPGDGDFQLAPIVEHLRRIGYAGCVSVEAMNPQLWAIAPRQFGEVAMTALRRVLGQAAMQ